MIVVDTSAVYALLDRADADHPRVASWMRGVREELVTTPLALAEMDHLLHRFGGSGAAGALRADLDAGAYLVEWWPEALSETLEVAERHASMELGLTDASLVALAARVGTTRIATLDQRHFRSVAPLGGEPAFKVLPADA